MKKLSETDLSTITSLTLKHYETHAVEFWEGTRHHDVTQNHQAFLDALAESFERRSLRILDLGCGPGRDLAHFASLGHQAVGLDGCARFCEMARQYSGCCVLHQDFLKLNLEPESFEGIFANASLFHVPGQKMAEVLADLRNALVPGGILFCSNPRGSAEGWTGDRYGTYWEWDTYQAVLKVAGFETLTHYYRPPGLPLKDQPWLAAVSRRPF